MWNSRTSWCQGKTLINDVLLTPIKDELGWWVSRGKWRVYHQFAWGSSKYNFIPRRGWSSMVWKGECGRKMAISHVEKHLKMFFGFSSRNVGQILLDGFLGDSTREVNKKKAPSFFWGPGPCLGPGENYPKICYGAIFSSMKSGSRNLNQPVYPPWN